MTQHIWQFRVDRGGTFTDVVARSPSGALHTAKLLSQDPGRYEDATVEAMHRITGTPHGAALPPADLRLGTTVATNALLERKGAPTLLAITRGHGDALRIGTQERPDLFARAIILPDPLYAQVVEIEERIRADGSVDTPLDEEAARAALAQAHAQGLRSVAIVLMHGWRHTAHEVRLAQIAQDLGFTQISVSHRVAPVMKLIARGDTTVADAYLSPVLGRYVAGLTAGLGPNVTALFMQSGGTLAPATRFSGKDAVLSGPAGGIVGMAAAAHSAGLEAVVGFDMGGTSTDVSWYSGRYERLAEARIAGTRLATPMMQIHTVAAGGGSICRFDQGRLQVGPHSAGAVPGPACYRRGGPLTVTDCNLILGRIQPEHFPAMFGPAGDQPLDRDAAVARLEEIRAHLPMTQEALAEGFLAIAVANMAHAIKAVSLRRGHDVTRAALVSFGGAGGQHACAVADALSINTVLCHPLASLLSAYGMGLADQGLIREVTLAIPLDDAHAGDLTSALDALGAAAEAELGLGAAQRRITLALRPAGGDNAIEVPLADLRAMQADFDTGWRRRFGYAQAGALIVERARIEVFLPSTEGDLPLTLPSIIAAPTQARMVAGGQWADAPLWQRADLAAGFSADGPALIVDAVSTIVVDPGWRAQVDGLGNVLLRRIAPRAAALADTACDPVRLEIMGALFMAVAEEMGAALQYSASSVNIRERLDFSCAIFDAAGALIANAPHMPVHLGSMGESVRCVIDARAHDGRGILPGDAYALNAPFSGGTHLPDITLVMPVFADGDDRPAWFVAARGHHADVGGISPGSMPPGSTSLAQEGIVLDNVLAMAGGRLLEEDLRARLSAGPYPARNIDQNIADLRAQIAACLRGASELTRIAAEQSRPVVDAYMEHVQTHAEAAVRALLGRLQDGAFTVPLDVEDAAIHVAIRIAADEATIDLTGTSPQLAGNFNAPLPVVRAAVLYALRCLIDTAVPMNEGCLRPIRLIVPAGSMLRPDAQAAVVAGNVETSQALCDAIFAALGAMAASQGTMNNFTFGNERYQYYETIAGGAGAGPGFAGASAVQTHMTNSRLTDPEVLESKFPVLLERFAIRHGSGGAGQWAGGDGVVRHLRFLEPMQAGILSGRRRHAPFGLSGGGDAACGETRVVRANGEVETLASCASVSMEAGDAIIIETPGGGGFGALD